MSVAMETVLVVSVTLNCCWGIFLGSCFGLKMLGKWMKEKDFYRKGIRTRTRMLLAKILTEQLLTWSLIIYGLVILVKTDVVRTPFALTQKTSLIRIGFSVNLAKYVFRALTDLYIHKISLITLLTQLHHIIALLSYCIMVVYQENLLLGVVGFFMEASNICTDGLYLVKHKQNHLKNMRAFLSLFQFGSAIVFRLLVPLAAVIGGLVLQSPLIMGSVSLAVFFLSLIFFAVFNGWLIRDSLQKVLVVYKTRQFIEEKNDHCESGYKSQKFAVKNNISHPKPCHNANLDVQGSSLHQNNLGKTEDKVGLTQILEAVSNQTVSDSNRTEPKPDHSQLQVSSSYNSAPYLAYLLATRNFILLERPESTEVSNP